MPAYVEIMRGRVRSTMAYRVNTAFQLAVVVVQVFILHKVWTALYAGATEVNGLTLNALLGYLTIANLQNWALQQPEMSYYVSQRVREGQIAFDLIRPAGFVQQLTAHFAGAQLVMAFFTVVALPVVALLGSFATPASPQAFGLWLLSMLCGGAVALLLNLIMAMTAFFTTEIGGVLLLYYLINQFLAGALIPLSFFPDVLRTIADLLPFRATTYTPASIYIGHLSGETALRAIAMQALWVLLLAIGVRLLWRAAKRRVVVQGG
jgi:ABC-type uncharacterized transport system permease subunit